MSLCTENEETSCIAYSLRLGSNLRAVLLHEGAYVQDLPIGEGQTVSIANATGKYQVRLAAESAKVDATLSFSEA